MPVKSTMITPKLTAALVVMTALAGLAPAAVFAQEDTDTAANVFDVDQTVAQVADSSADDNVQVNNAEVKQSIENEAECDDDCGAEVNVDDQTQISNVEQENEIETGDVEQEQEDIEQENEFEDILAIALADLDLS